MPLESDRAQGMSKYNLPWRNLLVGPGAGLPVPLRANSGRIKACGAMT